MGAGSSPRASLGQRHHDLDGNRSSTATMNILVAIASYGTNNGAYLERLLAEYDQYLSFINCQQSNQDRLGALVGGQFEQTATTSEGRSRAAHLAFRRIHSGAHQQFSRLSVPKQT